MTRGRDEGLNAMTQAFAKLTGAEKKQAIQALPSAGRAAEARQYIPLPTSRKPSGVRAEKRIVKS